MGVLAIISEFLALDVSAESSAGVAMFLPLVFADQNVVVGPVRRWLKYSD